MKKLYYILSTLFLTITFNSYAQIPTQVWNKTIGGNGDDYLFSTLLTDDGEFILGGYSNSNISEDKSEGSRGYNDYWIIKTDANGNKLWDKTFGGNENDYLSDVQQTMDGGFILGGYSNSNNNGEKSEMSKGVFDYWIIKIDSLGNKEWDKTFGGNSNDMLCDILQTKDGGYIMGGYSFSGISGDKTAKNKGMTDYWIIKTDKYGNKVWDKTFGGSYRDVLNAIQETLDGGYILGGYSISGISEDKTTASIGFDFWIIKLDSNGLIMWEKTYGGNKSDILSSFISTSDGGYMAAGYSSSDISGIKTEANIGANDFLVIKLDINGNVMWNKTFGGINTEELYTLQQDSDGGYILGGYSSSNISHDKTENNIGVSDYWIIKLDKYGNKLWDKTFGGNNTDILYSVVQISSNEYILGGYSISDTSFDKTESSKGGFDFWIVKIATSCSTYQAPAITQNEIINFCDAGKYILEVGTWSSYQWSTGETTPTIKARETGSYSVTVTDTNGCIRMADTLNINYDNTNLLASYTIIASKKIQLSESIINNSAIGIYHADGKIKLQQTIIQDENSFVKAPEIKMDNNSIVTNAIYENTTFLLPFFEANTFKDKKDIKIKKKETIILSDTLYGKITLSQYSKVIFTQSKIYIEELMSEHESGIIQFTQDAKVIVKKNVIFHENTIFNPDAMYVILYVGNHVEINKGASIIATIYAPNGKIIIEAKDNQPVIMKGLFIAEKINAKGKTYWYHGDICKPSLSETPLYLSINNTIAGKMENQTDLTKAFVKQKDIQITTYPNPFTSNATLNFTISYNSSVTISLFNSIGEKIATLFDNKVNAEQQYAIPLTSSGLSNGIYFYQFITSQEKHYGKLIMFK